MQLLSLLIIYGNLKNVYLWTCLLGIGLQALNVYEDEDMLGSNATLDVLSLRETDEREHPNIMKMTGILSWLTK